MKIKKSGKNIALAIVLQLISILFSLILPRMLILTYGSETNGYISSVAQVLSYLSILEAGVAAASMQALYKPLFQKDQSEINSILAAVQKNYRRTGRLYGIFVIVLALLYPLSITADIGYIRMAVIVLVSGLPSVINYMVQGKYRIVLLAEGKNYVCSAAQIIATILSNSLKALFIWMCADIMLVQGTAVFSSLIQIVYYSCYIRRHYNWLDLKAVPDFQAISQKKAVLVHNIAGLVFNNTDIILITYFCGLRDVSIYSIYNALFSFLTTAVTSVTDSLRFIFGEAYQKGLDYYILLLDSYEAFLTSFIFSLYFVAFKMILPFVSLYTEGADINYINSYLPTLFCAIKLIDSGRSTALTTIYVAGTFQETKNKAIIECIINLTVSIISMIYFGMIGVLFGTVAALVYRVTDTIIFTNHFILRRKAWRSFSVWVQNILVFLLMLWAAHFFDFYADGYLEWALKAAVLMIICILVFVGSTCVIRRKEATVLFKYLSSGLKRISQG